MRQTTSSPANLSKVLLRNGIIMAAIILVMALVGDLIWLLSRAGVTMIALRYMLIAVGVVCMAFFAGLVAIMVRYKRQQQQKQ